MGGGRGRRGSLSADTNAAGRPALFVDRDGVLNEPVWREPDGPHESPLRCEDIRLTAGSAAAVRRARDAGLAVVVVSNQPAAAKGTVSLQQLRAVHGRVLDLLGADGGRVDASYVCWHHPAGVVPELTADCPCRKPRPGLLHRAADDLGLDLGASWLVGDTDADVGAAHAAGLAGVALVLDPRSAHRRGPVSESADIIAADTPTAVDLVLTRRSAAGSSQ